MEQNTRMIKTIYTPSDIKRMPSQVQYQILRFLSGYTPDYQFEWKLARKHGLQIRVEETHSEMFKNQQATCKYIIIIACSNWTALRKALKKDLHTQWENERKVLDQMYIL